MGFPVAACRGRTNVGGAVWTPAALSPVVWLKNNTLLFSDAGTTPAVDTDPVYRWGDSTGNGFHANQTTLGNRPIYSAANQWAAFTAASNHSLVIPAGAGINFTASQPRTYMLRLEIIASTLYGMFMSRGDGYDEIRFNAATGMPEATDSTDAAQSASELATSTQVLLTGVFGNTGPLQLWRNGTLDSEDASYTGRNVTGQDISLGVRAGGGFPASMRLLDFLVFPSRLEEASIAGLATSYWGLPA